MSAATITHNAGRPTAWARFAANRLAVADAVVLVIAIAVALAAPLLPIAAPDATDLANRLLRPLAGGHLLGTDHLGRDLLSRLVYGTRSSLAVGIAASLVAAVAGSLIGLAAGYIGGRADNLIMRGIDMVMGFPYILLALAIVAVLGPGLLNALYAIAVVNIPFFARNIRGVTIGLVRRDFVDAARLSGKGHVLVLTTELLPNVLPTIVIALSTTVGWMILETAGLSFLGLGAQPPDADLGSMLGEGRKVMFAAPHVAIVPGAMIFVLVMAINLIGDGIRDLLDPRLAGGALTRPAARTAVAPDRPRADPAPAAAGGAVLEVQGLRTWFEAGSQVRHAVDGVDFALRPGECLGLIGESGSGKTVTALSVLSLVPSPSGRIVAGRVGYGDEDLLDVSYPRLRRLRGGAIGYVFQDPLASLHPLLTVGAQIIEAIRAHRPIDRRSARAQALALLERVRIPNAGQRFDAYPHEFSGGMRQRVCIAMALANDPDLLIADEPTTALDVTVQAQMLKLLDVLRRQHGSAVLFITHDFGIVSEICDRVAVMYAGRIVETGPVDALLGDPAHPYTRKLIDSVPVLGGRAANPDGLPGTPPIAAGPLPGCAFADRCDRAAPDCRAGDISLAPLPGQDRSVRCLHPLTDGRGGDPT